MPNQLDITRGFAVAFKNGVDSVMRDHEIAMIIGEVEDLLAYGIVVFERWMGCRRSWDAWVSESMERYDPAHHDTIRAAGADLVQTGRRLSELITRLINAGFAIERENEFGQLLSELESHVGPIPADFQRDTLRGYLVDATLEYESGRTEEAVNPWS